jgi:7-carboxy-7-deazaguanine synthase
MPNGKSEIYLATQGEGRTLGKPMVFTRLATCNLMCTWCDTFYTWNFEDIRRVNPHKTQSPVKREDFVKEMTVEEVANDIFACGVKAVCFTGGEPTLQQKDNLKVMENLMNRASGWHFETETNGTLNFADEYIRLMDQINCSPKLESSGNIKQVRSRPQVIKQFKESGKAIFKFVVTKETSREDLYEIEAWQRENNIPNSMVWLMPEGTEKERIIEGTRFLIENFQSSGYNISTRLQVICFGSKRLT